MNTQTTETPLIALDVRGLVATIREAVKEELQGQMETLRPMLEDRGSTRPEATEYLTREETSELLKVSFTTLREWKSKGILTPYKIGGRTLYKRLDVDKAVKGVRGGRKP